MANGTWFCHQPSAISHLRDRQQHRERRPPTHVAAYLDGAAVSLDDGLDEAEAEPETALGAALVAAEEPIEDPRELIGRNAWPGVPHAKERGVHGAADLDVHAAAGRRVLHGVVEEVRGDLLEPRPIGGHP